MSAPTMPRPKSSEWMAAIYRASVLLNVTIEQIIEAMPLGRFNIIPEEEG